MAFSEKTKDLKMPMFVAKAKKKSKPGDNVDDIDSLFGEAKSSDEPEEGTDEEEAGETDAEEAGEDELADELSEFSDDELEMEVERRKNEKGAKGSKKKPAGKATDVGAAGDNSDSDFY